MRTSRMPEDTYDKRKESGGKLPVVLLFLLVAAFIAAAVFAGGWLSDNVITPVAAFFSGSGEQTEAAGAQAQAQAIELDAASYYLLQSGVYADEANASEAAAMMADRGGAGYILKDGGKHRVILAAYLTETDAKEVRDRLELEQAVESYVYTLAVPAYTVKLEASAAQTEAVRAALTFAGEAAGTLVAISEDLDRGSDVTPDMDILKNDALEIKSRVQRELSGSGGAAKLLAEYCVELCDEIIALPDNIKSRTAETSSALKYAVVSVIDGYSQFVSGLK